MILITGATGTIGSALVSRLLADGVAVRAATRDPAAASFPAAVDVVRVDYRDPATFAPAMAPSPAPCCTPAASRPPCSPRSSAARSRSPTSPPPTPATT